MSHPLLVSLGHWIFEPLPLEEMFDRVVKTLATALPQKIIQIYYNHEYQNLKFGHLTPLAMASPSAPVAVVNLALDRPLDSTIVAACQEAGQRGLLLEYTSAEPQFQAWLHDRDLRNLWGMVFGFSPGPGGMLIVQQQWQDQTPWDPQFQGVLQGIALQLTVLVQQRSLGFDCRSQPLPQRHVSPALPPVEGTLLRSETRLRAVLQNAPLIVYALDREGHFLLSEGQGLDRLGLKPGQVVGQSALELYKDYPETLSALQDALRGNPRSWIAHIGSNVYDCRVSLLHNDKGEVDGLIGVSTDITDLMQAQTALDHLFLGTAAVTGQDFFIALVKYLSLALGAQYAMINELQDDRFCTLAFWDKGQVQENICYAVVDAPGCSRVLAQQESLYVPEMGEERNCPLLKPLKVSTYLGTPLQDPAGNILGTLCILNDRPLKDPQQAQRILKIFAARAGAELHRIRVEKALEDLNTKLENRVQERTQLLKESQQRFQHLVQNVPGAVYQFSLNTKGERRVIYISDYITQLLGIKAADIEANADFILSRIHPLDKANFEQSVEESWRKKSRWTWDGRFLHQDGTYRWLRGISHPIEQPDRSLLWDGILVDITDRKSAEDNMDVALKQQRELNEIKSKLITTMSHEFRTPLAVIGSSASILRAFSQQLPEEKKQRHLQTIETYIQHTTKLLEDVLLLNRVSAGRLSFQPTRINLIQFFSDLITEVYLSTGEYPMQFQAEMETGFPYCIVNLLSPSNKVLDSELSLRAEGDVDVKLLRQIVLNLIDNAVKYSTGDRHPIKVYLKLTAEAIQLEIQDHGIGIEPKDQKRLFEPFHRGENVGQRSGTGIGLSVVKNCIELHQGTIEVCSVPSQGTGFTLTFPRYQFDRDTDA